jgi:hypothetical protein
LGGEVVGGLGQRQAHVARELGGHRRAEARRRVESRAHRRAPEWQLAHSRQGGSQAVGSPVHLGGVPAQLLPERERRGVHEVGSTGLHHLGVALRLVAEDDDQVVERRQEVDHGLADRREVDRRGEHVVGRLRGIHLVVRVHRPSEALAGEVGDDLVHVHVGGRAGAGLEDVDGELVVPFAFGHLGRRVVDGVVDVLREHAQAVVHARRRPLDRGERADERPLDPEPGDREVVDRPLGLGTPARPRRHSHLSHGVVLGAELV